MLIWGKEKAEVKDLELEVREIYKSFSGKQVLHGVSFKVEPGKALGLLGRNGAGKTTTIRIIMDLFKPNKGEILLNGKKFKPREHQIGYLPEERGLYPKKKVMEQLLYLGQLRGLKREEARDNANYWLERLEVIEYKDKKLETLSKGNQQKVQLAQTFLCNPNIIILDEPFSGLDPVNSQLLKEIITEFINTEKLIIFSSHQMNYVEEFCDEIALIDEGNIVLTGNLKDIKLEYGKNRLTIGSMNLDVDQLERLIKDELGKIVSLVEKRRNYLIVELMAGMTKNNLLQAIVDKEVDLERFSVYEPDLADIFVQKVGEN